MRIVEDLYAIVLFVYPHLKLIFHRTFYFPQHTQCKCRIIFKGTVDLLVAHYLLIWYQQTLQSLQPTRSGTTNLFLNRCRYLKNRGVRSTTSVTCKTKKKIKGLWINFFIVTDFKIRSHVMLYFLYISWLFHSITTCSFS